MTTQKTSAEPLDHFFSASAARMDRWRELNAKAQAWGAAPQGDGRASVEEALANVRAMEDFFAYPGPRLMKALQERIADGDALGVGRLVRRMSGALLSGSYRYESGEWETADDGSQSAPDRSQAVLENGDSRRPY